MTLDEILDWQEQMTRKLHSYGGLLITTDPDAQQTVELVGINDNARRRFQYRLASGRGIERRVLTHNGSPMTDGSPWERLDDAEVAHLYATRGIYHPILDSLGLSSSACHPDHG